MPNESFRREFIAFAVECGVLSFGQFVLKSGRVAPYFFNAGLFNTGARLGRLADFYARAIRAARVEFDMVFGPAYKGITLAAATAIALSRDGIDVPYAFNRKEEKDHGEGGDIVGAPLKGRVLIVDDVITAGTAVRESLAIIKAAQATPIGVALCMDRMERGAGTLSAVQEVEQDLRLPVVTIANLDDLLGYLAGNPTLASHRAAVQAYRQTYGAAS